MKWVIATTLAAVTLAVVLTALYRPGTFLHAVLPVFLIWVISGIVNWLGISAMVGTIGLKVSDLKGQSGKARIAVALAMGHRTFWIGFWVSLGAWVANTLCPLGLIGSLPLWTVLTVLGINAAGNIGALPLRIWLWKIHTEKNLLTQG